MQHYVITYNLTRTLVQAANRVDAYREWAKVKYHDAGRHGRFPAPPYQEVAVHEATPDDLAEFKVRLSGAPTRQQQRDALYPGELFPDTRRDKRKTKRGSSKRAQAHDDAEARRSRERATSPHDPEPARCPERDEHGARCVRPRAVEHEHVFARLTPDPGVNRTKVRGDARPTSRAAAKRAWPKTGTQRWRIIEVLSRYENGLTDDQIARLLAMSPNTERPRRGELVEDGWVEPAPGQGSSDMGNPALRWRISDPAWERLRDKSLR